MSSLARRGRFIVVGAPVNVFFYAAPPRRCLLLDRVGGHRRDAAMGAGNIEAEKGILITEEGGLLR